MKKWTLIDSAKTPEGKTISLLEHDGDYHIQLDTIPLMSTRQHASEDRLAELACAHVAGAVSPKVLIAGLGMGFTLNAALAVLPPRAEIVVAELMPCVIEWNRNPAISFGTAALADSRVAVLSRDVAAVIGERPSTYDSIMLDVDNGPHGLTTDANDSLYSDTGLQRIFAALKPGGTLGVWSDAPSAWFEKAMVRAGFRLEVHRCRSHGSSGRWHRIFMGKRSGGSGRL